MKSDVSGHITFIANHISKLDKNEPYPTIVLKSDNKYAFNKFSNTWQNTFFNKNE